MIRRLFITILCLSIGFSNYGFCQVYKWTDEDGTVNFSDDFGNVPERYRDNEQQGKSNTGMQKDVNKKAIKRKVLQGDEDVQGFSDSQTGTIKAAISEWKKRYVCGRSIEVTPFKGSSRVLDNGIRETIEETAGPGYIKMDPESKFSFRNTILHSMTHACQPDSPNMLSTPIQFNDGMIIGYQGASIMVKLRNGRQTFFRKMEEGLCERNASFFPGYSVPNRRYFAVGKLARQHFPQGRDPMTMIRNNDVPGLASVILNKEEVFPGDIEKVIDLYQKAWSAGK